MQILVKSTQIINKKYLSRAIINLGDIMDCIFCKIVNKEFSSKAIYEDEFVLAFLDINPKVNGHTLIVPKKHYTDFTELSNDLLVHINDVAKKLSNILMDKLNATGISILVNYGTSQEVKHYHLHLLPQDSNYKEIKSVDEIYEILTK